jgi:hypothetical protein
MLRWKCLESALLGACLAASPLMLFAQGPGRVERALATDEGVPRRAADRWNRLKTLYPPQEARVDQESKPGTATLTDESPAPSSPPRPFRVIPDESSPSRVVPIPTEAEPETGSPSDDDQFELPRRNLLEKELPPPRPGRVRPLIPLDEEPNWVLPAIVDPGEDQAKDGDNVVPPSPTRTAPVIEEPSPSENESDQSPNPPVKSPRGVKPSVPATAQIGHSQVTDVRYRKIANIQPFLERSSNGQEVDQDIREWAKAQSSNIKLGTASSPYQERMFPAVVMPWDAPNFFHYPLYFEDPALERYGHTHHPLMQPVASISRFGVQLLGMPYQLTINPPCREVYALGWYRPGECAPKLHYQVPLDAKAAGVQAATVTGLFFLIP